MALLSKKPAPFTVPTMAETDSEYASRLERLTALSVSLSNLNSERHRVDRELAASPPPSVRPSVAALLGDDTVDERVALRTRLGEIKRAITDHEAAIELQKQRVDEARGRASQAVCVAVKPEYSRRVAALVKALEEAHAARMELRHLVDDLESDGVSWTSMGVFEPNFLGDRHDGHVQRLAREAKEAGYV